MSLATMAHRTGSPRCWARTQVQTSTGDSSVCVSREQWHAWLAWSGSEPCGEWQGKWGLYSPALNDGGDASSTKKVLHLLRVTQLPSMTAGAQGSRLWSLRQRLELARERAATWITPSDETGILRMLVLGQRTPGRGLELLTSLGFVHLLSAAGLHLYALARLCSLGFGAAFVAGGVSLRGARAASGVVTTAVWLAAWLLAGARLGMLRPWVVVILRLGGRGLGTRWTRLAPLGVAMTLDLGLGFWRGDLGTNPGRWVYLLACGGGLIGRGFWGVMVGSWVLAAALEAWRHGLVALGTPLWSVVSAPLFAGAIYPGVILALVLKNSGLPADPLIEACGWAASWAVRAFAAIALTPGSLWVVGRPALATGLALGALMLWLKPWPRWRVAVLGMLCAVGSWGFARPQDRGYRVHQLDVGQGDSALVGSAPAALDARGAQWGLIDVGPERALTERDWLELLASHGVRRLSWIALTHLDEDHAGGLRRLARVVPIDCVATAREQLSSERGARLAEDLERAGVRLTSWEGRCVPVPVLAPPDHGSPSLGRSRGRKANAHMSAVLVPLVGGGYYLSAGDADSRDEPRIGAWAVGTGAAYAPGPRVLKVSHHGSKTSSAPEFLRLVRPTEMWISDGVGNHYGHPAPRVLERLRGLGVPIHRTDQEGELEQ